MLNKEDILALAWEHSEGSGKRYTFTEESLFDFLEELKKEPAPAQDEREAFEEWFLSKWPANRLYRRDALPATDPHYDEYSNPHVHHAYEGWMGRAIRPAQSATLKTIAPEDVPAYVWGESERRYYADGYNTAIARYVPQQTNKFNQVG